MNGKNIRHWLLTTICLMLATTGAMADRGAGETSAANSLDYSRLFVFSAGIHKFENDHLHPGRPAVVTQDIKLIKTLLDKGVTQDHVVALRDEDATTANCRSQLQQLMSRAKPGDTLLVFIHSHGSLNKGGLVCTYETGGVWPFDDLIQQIEQGFAGDKVCLCVCACHAGSLVSQIKSVPRRLGYFAVTSVHPDVSALTVATSDFEACVRDAFGGAPCPDLNGDGVTTFSEFGRYLSKDQSTLFGTKPDVGWTEKFDPAAVITEARQRDGALDCALVRLRSGIRGRVVKQENGNVLVRGAKNPAAVEWVPSKNVTVIGRSGD